MIAAIHEVAIAIRDAATPMGALEGHGKTMLDSAKLIAAAITDLADAVRESKEISD